MIPTTKFLRSDARFNVFEFFCSCGYQAELGVPRDSRRLISCPDCGALHFMIRPTGLFVQPRLLPVVENAAARA